MGVGCSTMGALNTLNMGKGQNEGGFSQEQLDMYKDCFKLMDINKDGVIDKNDLRGAFDNMVKMFQEKMAGEGNDSDDLIIQAFKAYDIEGKMDVKMFQHALKTWGDKMTKDEIDDIFGEFDIDEDYMVKTKEVLGLFVAQKEEEKKEEAPPPAEEAAPAEEDEGEAKKKKKKKKKAAAVGLYTIIVFTWRPSSSSSSSSWTLP